MKPRKYIKPHPDIPLVTRFGVVRLLIKSADEVEVFSPASKDLPVESGRLYFLALANLAGSKWKINMDTAHGFYHQMTPRRIQLATRAIERSLSQYHKQHPERFKRAERVRLNNEILEIYDKMSLLQKELDRHLELERDL